MGYPGVNLHAGIDDAFAEGFDVRGNIGFTYAGSSLTVSAEALYALPLDVNDLIASSEDLPLTIYIGAEPIAGIGGEFTLGANVIGGEYRLGAVDLPQGGGVLEPGPEFDIIRAETAGIFGYNARLGFNYHF